MLKRNNQMLAILLSVLLVSLSGCNGADRKNKGDKVSDDATAFYTAKFERINIDGVDCIVGAGNWDSAAAITCDWKNKKAN